MSRNLSLFSFLFIFTLWSTGTAKSTIRQCFFFLLTITKSGLDDLFVSQNLRKVRVSHFPGRVLSCAYTTSYGQI